MQPDPAAPPILGRKIDPLPSEATPYDLAPEPPPQLGKGRFVDELPEDADLEHDPEVERVLKGEPLEPDSVDAEIPPAMLFVKPGGDPAVLAAIGGGILLAAVITSCLRTTRHWFPAGALTLYLTLLNTICGVAAIAIVAHFERLRFGRVELAAARMLIAVSVAFLAFSFGQGLTTALTAPLGLALYLAALGMLFKVSLLRAVRVASVHAAITLSIYIAMIIYAWVMGSSA